MVRLNAESIGVLERDLLGDKLRHVRQARAEKRVTARANFVRAMLGFILAHPQDKRLEAIRKVRRHFVSGSLLDEDWELVLEDYAVVSTGTIAERQEIESS